MNLYSVKMRASKEGKHISGGERIVKEEDIKHVVNQLLNRPKEFDFINIKIDKLKKVGYFDKTLDIHTITFEDIKQANDFASQIISDITGIDTDTVKKYIDLVHTGASETGENMRGAMVVNTDGKRVELDKNRGVRTTNIDYEDRNNIIQALLEKGFTERTADALAIATKNLNSGCILAEYCISDDPDYVFGYVATGRKYIRIYPLKQKGNQKGGRIYFVKKETDTKKLYRYLEEKSFLIKGLGDIL